MLDAVLPDGVTAAAPGTGSRGAAVQALGAVVSVSVPEATLRLVARLERELYDATDLADAERRVRAAGADDPWHQNDDLVQTTRLLLWPAEVLRRKLLEELL